jgi:60kDa lysophospholipase
MEDWIRLATDIELNYASFDGFIVLHGTGEFLDTALYLRHLIV